MLCFGKCENSTEGAQEMTSETLKLLLVFVLGIVTSVAGNLLTPWSRRFSAGIASLGRRSMRGQIEQTIKPLQSELDQLKRFSASDRDLYLYLFRTVLAIITFCIGGLALLVLSNTTVVNPRYFSLFSFLLFAVAAMMSSIMVTSSRHYSTIGMPKRTARLQEEIAELQAKLAALADRESPKP
jgi:hypothetical protein